MIKKLLLLLLFFGFSSFPVFAESLNVSIRVGETILTFSGKASPEAQITFLEDGAVVGTTQADVNGDFSKSLTYFEEGIRTVGIYATDSQNRTTSTVSYSVSLTLGVNTTVGNVILPATIAISPSSLTAGEILTVSGEAVASSTVNLFFSNSTTASATASSQGVWQYDYDTGGLTAGDYSVYVKVSTGGGYISEQSETKTFSVSVVSTPTITPTPTPGPTSTPGPGPTSTPGPAATVTPTPKKAVGLWFLPAMLKIFDINDSGKIELAELCEVVQKWVGLWREKPKITTCDLNHDGKCNLVDFSILMYYVNR